MVCELNSLSMLKAAQLVLTDKRPKTDALFIHGSPVNSEELDDRILALGASMMNRDETKAIVINGLSDEICAAKKMAYPGGDTWGRKLALLGIAEVRKIQPSLHTAAESDNLIALAKNEGWKSVVIASLPHHVLRCMCQMVFCLERASSDLKVYARTLDTVDWDMSAKKTVLGGGVVEGTLLDHCEAEAERLVKYADKNGVGYTPHATLEELIAYFGRRDI